MKQAVLCLSLVLASALAAQQPAEAPAGREIRMTAKKYEYNPGEIHVKQGERVRLLITALDRKHGFQLEELGIKTELEKGKETVVEFTAARAGTFEFRCSVRCGWGHRRMKGQLVVEPVGAND